MRYLKTTVIASLLLICQSVAANQVQVFYPASYQNPAKMAHTKDSRLVGGVFIPNVYDKFKGTILGTKGSTKTNYALAFPYMMLEQRFSDRVVAGFDVSNPLLAYILWPANGFQAAFGIDTILNSYELTPKISVKITDNFAVGASFRYLNIYRAELNYDVLDFFLMNRATGEGFGGAVGCSYTLCQKTIFDFCFFSPISSKVNGRSISGPFVNSEFFASNFKYCPTTYILNILHVFNQTFLASLRIAYSLWHGDQQLVLNNVAIGPNPTILNLEWKNTVNAALYGRIQAVKKFAILGLFGYDQSPVNSGNNAVLLPLGHVFYGGAGGEYRFNSCAVFQVFAGQARTMRPKIHNPPLLVNGTNLALYTWVDISSTITF